MVFSVFRIFNPYFPVSQISENKNNEIKYGILHIRVINNTIEYIYFYNIIAIFIG